MTTRDRMLIEAQDWAAYAGRLQRHGHPQREVKAARSLAKRWFKLAMSS